MRSCSFPLFEAVPKKNEARSGTPAKPASNILNKKNTLRVVHGPGNSEGSAGKYLRIFGLRKQIFNAANDNKREKEFLANASKSFFARTHQNSWTAGTCI